MTLFDTQDQPSATKQMRDHQELFIEQVRASAKAGHKRIIGCASVGWGKTLVSANLFKSGYSKGKVSMFTVPRNALIEPSVEEFEGEGLRDIGIIQQAHPKTNPDAKLQVASIHTAVNRELPHVDFAIVDEVHMMTDQFQALLDSPEWADKIVIGLSATPWRKGMGRKWTALIQTKTTAQLIEEGYLVKPRYLVGSEDPSLEGRKTHLDEEGNRVLTEKDEAAVMGEQRIIGDIVKTYLKHGEDRPGFYYAVNLAHARQLCEEFEKEGIPAGYIDGTFSRQQRQQILKLYREGHFRVLVCYAVLTTGIDQDVRIIGICRIIKSETDWVQIIGRGLRNDNPSKRIRGMAPKVDCLVIDHGGNLTRDDGTALAPAEDIYHDHLDMHDPLDKSQVAFEEDARPETHRKCKKCGSLIPPRTKNCLICGEESKPAFAGKHVEAEFSEFNGQKTKAAKSKKKEYTPAMKDAFYAELIYIADDKGRKRGWADHVHKEKFGHFPTRKHGIAPVPPSQEVTNYVRSRNIARAKANQKETVTV